uniref:CC domain-containing protein n=1 Tax=Parascaris univalens TaxID=6257 RepID=A0A915AIS3_PARUN
RSGGYCSSGYVCTADNACCRCLIGASAGSCTNGICPAGYLCSANNYCCPYDIAPQQRCIYGQCPTGYSCGAGQFCYPLLS